MSLLTKKTIGEIAAESPGVARLFEILDIDYSCHGNLTLREACGGAGLDPEQVRMAIEQLPRGDELNWLEQPVPKLVAHLRDEGHAELGAAMARSGAVLASECRTCSRYPALVGRVRVAFGALADTLRPHMTREEHLLFPAVEHLDRCWTEGEASGMQVGGGVPRSVQVLVLEHGAMIGALDEVNRLVEEVLEQPVPCRDLIDTLRALDHALREHVHLENNVLFPRAMVLNAAVRPTASGGGVRR